MGTYDANNPMRPISGGFARPLLSYYFTDTNVALTREERKLLENGDVILISVTPREILMQFNGRMIAVRNVDDPLNQQ